jgi:hypothetical protein
MKKNQQNTLTKREKQLISQALRQKTVPKQKKQRQEPIGSNVAAPIAMGKRVTNNKMDIRSKNGLFVVKHRELVKSLTFTTGITGGSYLDTRLRLNPGSEKTFPWLSGIAPSFEFYRFRKLSFDYVPRCSTSTDGAVIMAIDYDAADAAPISEVQTCAMQGATEISFWQPAKMTADPLALNRLYKAHPNMDDARFSVSQQDEKTVDCGQLLVWFNSGSGSNISVGKLWVEYEVEFSLPQPNTFPPTNVGGDLISKTVGLTVNSATPFSTNSLQSSLGQAVPVVAYNSGAFPSRDLVKFVEDFEGLVVTAISGTSLTAVGGPLVNGVAQTPVFGTVLKTDSSQGVRTDYITAKAGDLLGWGQMSGAAFVSFASDIIARANVNNLASLPLL